MNKDDLRNGDIVRIDYIEEFTKKHIKYDALILWKDDSQPLILKINELFFEFNYRPIWICYEYISKIIGYIDMRDSLINNIKDNLLTNPNIYDII